MCIEDDIQENLNKEIVYEILKQEYGNNSDITYDLVEDIWKKCSNNPWNAAIVYTLEQLKSEKNT